MDVRKSSTSLQTLLKSKMRKSDDVVADLKGIFFKFLIGGVNVPSWNLDIAIANSRGITETNLRNIGKLFNIGKLWTEQGGAKTKENPKFAIQSK